MTENERMQIEAYLPNPRDPELQDYEFYYQTENGRVFKVFIDSILPPPSMKGEYCQLTVCYSHNGRRVHTYRDFDAVQYGELYDNKQDCRDRTHDHIEWWESLRELQDEERVHQ